MCPDTHPGTCPAREASRKRAAGGRPRLPAQRRRERGRRGAAPARRSQQAGLSRDAMARCPHHGMHVPREGQEEHVTAGSSGAEETKSGAPGYRGRQVLFSLGRWKDLHL